MMTMMMLLTNIKMRNNRTSMVMNANINIPRIILTPTSTWMVVNAEKKGIAIRMPEERRRLDSNGGTQQQERVRSQRRLMMRSRTVSNDELRDERTAKAI